MDLLEKQERILELQLEISQRRDIVHAKTELGTITRAEENTLTSEVEDLLKQLSTVIADGAKPCPFCGEPPHGMAQMIGVKKDVRELFEVGCLAAGLPMANGERHPQARATDVVPDFAVARWNKGKYDPDSAGPGAKMVVPSEDPPPAA